MAVPERDLTPMELFVLRCLANGDTQREAGARLGATRESVNMASFRIRRTLGAKTTVHAVVIAIRTGLVTLEDP